MRKARPLLLLLLLALVVLYLRLLASWRPQKLFVGATRISQLHFSSDGRTLLVGQNSVLFKRPPRLLALDAAHGFGVKWSYVGDNDLVRPQFFSDDARVLVAEEWARPVQVLDAQTGKVRMGYGERETPVVSADGKWLASSSDRGASLWRAVSYRKGLRVPDKIRVQAGPQELLSSACAIAPDNRTLVVQVTEFTRCRLDFYDVQSGRRTRSWPDFLSRIFGKTVQWSRNGRYLLSTWYFPSGQSGSRMWWSLWRVGDGQKVASNAFPLNKTDCNFEVEDDGRVLSYWRDGQVLLSQPSVRATVSAPCINLPGETITAATLAPDGSYVVAGTRSRALCRQRVK